MSKRSVYYVLSTHWDREWYQPFQEFRHRLVMLLDRTLDSIRQGEIQGPFTTDGQSIVLEDYLEVRRDRAEEVRQLLGAGKLKAGPWYVLPDEWLVSGESLIRNLEMGRAVVCAHGGTPSNAGFLCDLFGHIGQMPQILAGFGIRMAFVWRGIEPLETAHFSWRSPDGTAIVCYRFGGGGYCDYTFEVRHAAEHAHEFDAAKAKADLNAFLQQESKRSRVQPVLCFDGADHLQFDSKHLAVINKAAADREFPFQLVHSTLDAYIDEALRDVPELDRVVNGELRETGRHPQPKDQQWLIPGVLSSRVYLKQLNATCESLLCQWAEPAAVMARQMIGRD